MRIGEMSRRSGVPASALRYWEQRGLMPGPARVSGRRDYGDQALRQVGLLLLSRACGFTLAETHRLFAPALAGKPPSTRWQMLAEVKLAEIARVERLLERMRSALESVRSCRCVDLEACGALALEELPALSEVGAERKPGGPRRNRRPTRSRTSR
jgi:MerR family transcriptional regulator, redox-sensitive transcriptional activator SoxR